MASEFDKLYRKALKAAAKAQRQSSGGKRLTPAERQKVRYMAREAASSPVYGALTSGRKVAMPSLAERQRASKRGALRYSVQSYRSGWGRSKVAPEHRQSLVEQSERMAEGGAFLPRAMREQMDTAKLTRERRPVALVNGEWFHVDHVKGSPSDGKPYFFGVGSGYDIARFVVFARDETGAVEIAEETWPKWFFEDIRSAKKVADDDDEWVYVSPGKVGKRVEDIRVFARAKDFQRTAKRVSAHSRTHRLTDGRLIEVG